MKSTSALLAPVLANGDLHTTAMDSILPQRPTVGMIINDDLDHALTWCAGLIDVARPRGWLIALAHASWLRSMALVRAGRIRAAEPDARLALEFKLGNTTPEGADVGAAHVRRRPHRGRPAREADGCSRAQDNSATRPQTRSAHLSCCKAAPDCATLNTAPRRPMPTPAPPASAGRASRCPIRHSPVWRVEAAEALDRPRRTWLGFASSPTSTCGWRSGSVRPHPRPLGCGRWRARSAPPNARNCSSGPSPSDATHRRPGSNMSGPWSSSAPLCAASTDAPMPNATSGERFTSPTLTGWACWHAWPAAELLAAGARPRRPAITGPESLTPAERHIASLAATGHSNRDIAGQLYITRRTVETHLTHTFDKLGISSRAELADTLGRPERSNA